MTAAVTAALPGIGEGLGIAGGVLGSIQGGNLERSAGAGLNDTIAQEQGIIKELQQLGIDTSSFAQELRASGAGYQSAAAGQAPGITGAARALQASPYLGELSRYGAQMAPGANPYLGQAGEAARGLEHYDALSPEQLGLLGMAGGNAARSAASTIQSETGGIPNEGLAYQQAVTGAGQVGMQTAAQLGANVAGENLQAREAGLTGLEQGAGTYLGSLEGGASTLGTAGQQYLQGEGAAGGLYTDTGGLFAGLGATDLAGAGGAYNTATNAYGQGLAGDQTIASSYLDVMKMGQQSGLGSLGALFGK